MPETPAQPGPTMPRAVGTGVNVSVVIPMYREAARIDATLRDCIPLLTVADYTSELILVDDGSPDDTIEIVAQRLTGEPQGPLQSVRLLRHKRNLGKGAAVRTGLAAASGDWRLIMDADNAATIRELAKLLAAADSGVGLVAGSRVAPGARVEAIASRKLTGSLFKAALTPLGLNLLADTQCGFKLYRADLADQITALATEDGYAFDLEHLLIAKATGLRIAEVGIRWAHKDGGQIDPVADGLKMLRRAADLRKRRRRLVEQVERLPAELTREYEPPLVVTTPAAARSAQATPPPARS